MSNKVPMTPLAEANTDAIAMLISQLAVIRENRGMTLVQAAKAMGVDKAAISRFETGKTNPTLTTVLRYATAVGANLAMFAIPEEQGAAWASLSEQVSDALEADNPVPAPKL